MWKAAGRGKLGGKWVWTGRLEGGVCEGAGRRPGGAERRRNGRSPFARRDGGRPAAGCCGFCRVGEEMRGRGGAGKGEGRWGRRGGGAAPFGGAESRRRSLRRPPGGRSGCAVMRGLLLFRRGGGACGRVLRLLQGGGGACPKWCAAGERTVPAGGSLV